MDAKKFDLIVIGTGPAGEKAAVKAAYFGYKVAIIEKEPFCGGAEVMTGTLPSKTLKETALYLSGKYEKGIFGINRQLEHKASVSDFMFRKNYVSDTTDQEIKENLRRHQVTFFQGTARFEDPHTLCIASPGKEERIYGNYIIIATGSYPYHPPEIPFDGVRVHDSDSILQMPHFPTSLCIVGAGVIGCEYATIFATMGTKVFLVNDKDKILPHLDEEIASTLVEQMEANGIHILFNTQIAQMTVPKNGSDPIHIELKNKAPIDVDMFLFAAGRSGNVKDLQLDKIGLKVGPREQILVDAQYRTQIPHIFAVGDVIGFPALASTSMDQGRIAVAHIFQTQDLKHLPTYFPYGIYTIPEVSMIGLSEAQAREKNIPCMTGKARYADMARGKILGCTSGFLKFVFHKETLQILGVHLIGHIATELVHYGVILVEEKKSLHDVIGQVFNFPTLHDLYKYAAYDGLSNYAGHRVKP